MGKVVSVGLPQGEYNDTVVLIINTIYGLDPHIVDVPSAVTVETL